MSDPLNWVRSAHFCCVASSTTSADVLGVFINRSCPSSSKVFTAVPKKQREKKQCSDDDSLAASSTGLCPRSVPICVYSGARLMVQHCQRPRPKDMVQVRTVKRVPLCTGWTKRHELVAQPAKEPPSKEESRKFHLQNSFANRTRVEVIIYFVSALHIFHLERSGDGEKRG